MVINIKILITINILKKLKILNNDNKLYKKLVINYLQCLYNVNYV